MLFVIAFSIILIINYYYIRSVDFILEKEIDKPSIDFDKSFFKGFEYVKNEQDLKWWLNGNYISHPWYNLQAYDMAYISNISKDLDFTRYDYIITYQKKLRKLQYSRHLAKTQDNMSFLKEKPLFPIWDTMLTNKIYIYKIKKNNTYRSPGP